MEKYGIGYGQLKDFKIFLISKNIEDFEKLEESMKQGLTRSFLSPKIPIIGTVKVEKLKEVKKNFNKKPDILSHYEDKIKPLFTVETLQETSHFEVYLTVAAKMGWMLEIHLKDRTVHNIPFMSKVNCEKVVNLIWKDWLPYAKEKEKMNE